MPNIPFSIRESLIDSLNLGNSSKLSMASSMDFCDSYNPKYNSYQSINVETDRLLNRRDRFLFRKLMNFISPSD